MKKTIFAIAFLVLSACTTTSQSHDTKQLNPRTPSQINENLTMYTTVAGKFGNSQLANVRRGNVTIDFAACNDRTVIRGSSANGDTCTLNFSNFFLVIDTTGAGLSAPGGRYVDFKNDSVRMTVGSGLREEALANYVIDTVSMLGGDAEHYSVEGSRLTLKNVTYIRF